MTKKTAFDYQHQSVLEQLKMYRRQHAALLAACKLLIQAEQAADEENHYTLLVEATEAARAAISDVVYSEMEILMQYYLTYNLERGLNSPSFLRRVRREQRNETSE